MKLRVQCSVRPFYATQLGTELERSAKRCRAVSCEAGTETHAETKAEAEADADAEAAPIQKPSKLQ